MFKLLDATFTDAAGGFMLANPLGTKEYSLNPVGIEADALARNVALPFAPEED